MNHPTQPIDPRRLEQADRLLQELWVPQPLSAVFPFFADARNLEELTPPWLNFSILTQAPITMQVGCLIDYRIKLYGVPMKWRTLISVWEPPHRFVDVQLSGPYSLWWHEHTFYEKDGGTLIVDHVRYRAPFHRLSAPLMVRRELAKIFSYRKERIRAHFGA